MEIEELYDSRRWLDGWAGRSGARPQLGELRLLPGELLARGALDHAVPDDQRLHEASGNEGVSLERAWHHAALVIWPRSRTLAILAGAGIGGAVAWVAAELDRNTGVADARIRRLASELVDMWPSGRAGHNKESRTRMLGLLSGVADKACISRFLHEVVLSHYTGSENEDLSAAMERVGPKSAGQFLLALVDAHFTQRPKETLALLRRVGEKRGKSAGRTPKDMLREAVRSVLRAVSVAPGRSQEGSLGAAAGHGSLPRPPPGRPERRRRPARCSRTPRMPKQLADQAVRDLFALAWALALDEARPMRRPAPSLPCRNSPHRTARSPRHWASCTETRGWRTPTRSRRCGATPRAPCSSAAQPSRRSRATGRLPPTSTASAISAPTSGPSARTPPPRSRASRSARICAPICTGSSNTTGSTSTMRPSAGAVPTPSSAPRTGASHKRRLAEYSKDVSWMRRLIRSTPGGPQVTDCAPDLARLQAAVAASRRK